MRKAFLDIILGVVDNFKIKEGETKLPFWGVLTITLFLCSFVFARAATVDEIQSKINDRNAQITALEKEIATYQQQIEAKSKEANTLKNAISILDATDKQLRTNILATQARISGAILTIEKLDNQIADFESKVGTYHESLAKLLQEEAITENQSLPELLLSGKPLSDSWIQVDRSWSFNESVQDRLQDIRAVEADLKDARDKKAIEKGKQEKYKKDLALEQVGVQANKQEKNNLLRETKNQESEYQKSLIEKLKIKTALENEIRNYESQLKFILDPSSIPSAGSVFAWPFPSVTITQLFGATVAAKRLYTSGSHNGVDFGTPIGTPVHAILSGTVLGVGDTDLSCPRASYGRFVFIKHDNGLASVYGHLSSTLVTEGQQVSTGDVIGLSGSTGYSTGPHLHISVFASQAVKMTTIQSVTCKGKSLTFPAAPINAYLDPMQYFPPYTKKVY